MSSKRTQERDWVGDCPFSVTVVTVVSRPLKRGHYLSSRTTEGKHYENLSSRYLDTENRKLLPACQTRRAPAAVPTLRHLTLLRWRIRHTLSSLLSVPDVLGETSSGFVTPLRVMSVSPPHFPVWLVTEDLSEVKTFWQSIFYLLSMRHSGLWILSLVTHVWSLSVTNLTLFVLKTLMCLGQNLNEYSTHRISFDKLGWLEVDTSQVFIMSRTSQHTYSLLDSFRTPFTVCVTPVIRSPFREHNSE